MKIRALMSSPVHTVGPDAPAWEAIGLMRSHRIRRLPVVEDGRLVGIVTWTDLVRIRPPVLGGRLAAPRLASAMQVRHLMTPSPQTISPGLPVEEAAAMMRRLKVGGLPVMEGAQLVGIVTESDLFEALVKILAVEPGEVRLHVAVENASVEIPWMVAELTQAEVRILAINTLRAPGGQAIELIVDERDEARALKALRRLMLLQVETERPLEYSTR